MVGVGCLRRGGVSDGGVRFLEAEEGSGEMTDVVVVEGFYGGAEGGGHGGGGVGVYDQDFEGWHLEWV